MADYNTIEELLEGERGNSVHVECGRDAVDRAVRFVHGAYANRRCAFFMETDKGFDRDTVRSYLRFFARIAGGAVSPEEAIVHFGLEGAARTPVKRLSPEQRALMNFARMSLFEPEVVFCERPLGSISADARGLVQAWLGQVVEAGGIVIPVATGSEGAVQEARYRLVTEPTPYLYVQTAYAYSDASNAIIREMGLFMDTEFIEGLPEGQRYFTPADLKSPGLLLAAQIILPRINRSPSVRQTVEFVLPI